MSPGDDGTEAAEILKLQLELLGKPYRWNAKGPDAFDCSGFITWPLWKVTGIDLRATHNTDRMLAEWEPLRFPVAGCVALFGGKKLANGEWDPTDVEHAMVVLPLDGGLPDLLIGACGGGRSILTLEDARRADARVKVKRDDHYRTKEFRGYRRLPIAA